MLNATVNQVCPSCNTDINCDAELERLSGTGTLRHVATEWTCPSCGVGYEQETPFDGDLMDVSGFHSWVGSIEDEPVCIIVEDDMGPTS